MYEDDDEQNYCVECGDFAAGYVEDDEGYLYAFCFMCFGFECFEYGIAAA